MDSATAYQKNARAFIQARSASGSKVTRKWAENLAPFSEVLEIACGSGYPITQELLASGLQVWAIDSSPTLINELKKNCPGIHARCERWQDSDFFFKTYDAVVAVGLIFLLPEKEQIPLLAKIASHLKASGHFLFTAPQETGKWHDATTGIECTSLGYDRYKQQLAKAGLPLVSTFTDSGKNNYYHARKLI